MRTICIIVAVRNHGYKGIEVAVKIADVDFQIILAANRHFLSD
jgi:hypothetical protein